MRAIRLRFTLGRMLVLVAVLGLASALVSERWRSGRRIDNLQAAVRSLETLLSGPSGISVWMGDPPSKVEAAGDRILMVASAHLGHQGHGPAYVWTACISRIGDEKVVFWKIYDRRIIWPARGAKTTTTFSDILRPGLPPGEYRVRVALYMVPGDAGLAPLNDEKARGGYEMTSSNHIIRLGEATGSLANPTSPMPAGDEARRPASGTAP